MKKRSQRNRPRKRRRPHPTYPNKYETVMARIESAFASPPSGFFPAFDSIYPGGGFRAGVGFRQFYARNAVWDIVGLYSIKNYKKIEVGTRTPWDGRGPVFFGVRAGWLDAPRSGTSAWGQTPCPM